jgi:flagellar biosynthesis/type III secretory pathway M-ring protein FliF/YscJ
MKKDTKFIFILLAILWMVCFFSLCTSFPFHFPSQQEPLTIDIDQDTIDNITDDVMAIKYKTSDSNGNYVIPKEIVDNMINNMYSIKNGINGNVKVVQTTIKSY